jgi:hypothetical protein
VYRDGDLSQSLLVYLDQGGQTPSQQYTLSVPGFGNITPGTPFPIPANQYSVTITLTAVDDNVSELTQDVTVAVLAPGNNSYTLGTPASTALHIVDNDPAAEIAISQVYASGREGGNYNSDYIELFNRGASTVDLSGRTVQYADAGNTNWQAVPLSGLLAPGQYYLVSGAGGGGGRELPTPDATSEVEMYSLAGKVALVDGTSVLVGAQPTSTDVLDLVGYGDADWYEGDGPAPPTDASKTIFRLGGGNYDTNGNDWDFTIDEPNPRDMSSDFGNLMPHVSVPNTQLTPADTSITFSAGNSSLISICDPDAGMSPLAITLNADNGTITLAGTAGLTFSDGDGTADESITFTGSLAAINAALNGLTYTPETGYHGLGTLTVWADDQGNTGTGGNLIDYGLADVVVGEPVMAFNDTAETSEDTSIDIDVMANDVWLGESTPSLTVTASPTHGNATVSQGIVTYTPNTDWHGSDSLTYQLNDGQGHTSTATVDITVTSVNDARIETTGDPNMYADEGELIDVKFDTPDATYSGNVTWSATGLPAGLTIDASGQTAGHIHGRPLYSDAQTNGGEWAVALTANYPGDDTDTVEFTWHVADVNRLPWIDDQWSQEFEHVNINYYAVDNINSQSSLTYSITGLPQNVPMNGSVPPGTAGDYDVAVSVSGGGATDMRQFHWSILPQAHGIPPGQSPSAGVAAFALNDTFVHQDDVGLVDVGLPVTVKWFVTELDYMHIVNNNMQIKLEVVTNNAGLSLDPEDTVGSNSITIGPDSSPTATAGLAQVYLIGHVLSAGMDDILVNAFRRINNVWVEMDGEGGENVVKAQITAAQTGGAPDWDKPGLIYNKDTPAAMVTAGRYRIPPRVGTDVWVKVDGSLDGKELWLVKSNGSADNGWAQLQSDGGGWSAKSGLKFTADGVSHFSVRGWEELKDVYQTKPGHTGQLQLSVVRGYDEEKLQLSDPFATSEGFSVAAIPIKVNVDAGEELKGTVDVDTKTESTSFMWGWRFGITFVSDSGETRDLDKVMASEVIVPREEPAPSGFFKNINISVGGWDLIVGHEWLDDIAIRQKYNRVIPKGEWIDVGPEALKSIEQRIADLKGGNLTSDQCVMLYDLRTGDKTKEQLTEANKPQTDGYKIAASGYTLTMSLDATAKPKTLTVGRVAAAVLGVAPGGFSGTSPHVVKIE